MEFLSRLGHSGLGLGRFGPVNRPGTLRVCLAAALLALLASALFPYPAQAQRAAELDKLKAAFVFQLTRYVEWPEESFETPQEAFRICVVGNDRMKGELKKAIAGKTFGERRMEIVDSETEASLATCHLVFIDDSERGRARDIIDRFMDKPMLTVSDSDDFTRDGGVVRLYRQSSKLRLEINVDAGERAELNISSKLLSLARVVHDR